MIEENKDNTELNLPFRGTGGLIYNVTIKVDETIADAWLQWMFAEHIPDIMRTGCFSSYRVVRLLEVDDNEGPTYAFQYSAESKADYNRYTEIYAPELRQRSIDKWGNGFIAFRSLMEVVGPPPAPPVGE